MSWGQTMLRTTSTLGVGTQRPSCPGRRSETGEQHDVGGRGSRAHRLGVPVNCHRSCRHSHPSQLHSRSLCAPLPSQECPFCSQSLERAVPVLQAQGEAPLRVRCQTTRTVTWGIWGAVPGTLFFPLFPPPPHFPNQPREAPDPGEAGEGKGSSPGAWFSFSCPESEPLWETSEGY